MPMQVDVPILAHQQVGDEIYRLTLESRSVAHLALPGQFVQVLYHDTYGPAMRRPFSIHDVDTEGGTFQIIYAARGNFTKGLSGLRPGDSLSVVGPLGQSFKLLDHPVRLHVAVAGGVGAPPLHFLLKRAVQAGLVQNLSAVIGARSARHLVVPDDFAKLAIPLHIATDDGSAGTRGTVLTVLQQMDADPAATAVYACGPEPMLKAVGAYCTGHGIACRLSLETVMPCGTGVCMGCVVKVRSNAYADGFEYVRACSDGPVFDAEEIVWD